jgi:hypothetical protein
MVVAVGGQLALVQVGLVLLALVGVAVLLRRRIERISGGRGARCVRLTPQHAVHTVEVEGRVLLVGTGPSGPPSLLDSWPAEPREHDDEREPTRPSVRYRPGWDLDG